jgi:L-seryl-tRNA(Ser) seleniumtransferase
MMERDGIVTIPVAGMPGAASVFRLMMFPDGKRLGDERLLASASHALETLVAVVDNAQRARVMLMGHA